MQILQVTIAAGSAPTEITAIQNTWVQQLIIQNNATHDIRVGDDTVTTTKGIVVKAQGGSLNLSPNLDYTVNLSQVYIAGTAGDIIDVLFIG